MFQFLVQRVHILIFSVVILGGFLSLFLVIDSYGEQAEYAQHCHNIVSIIENVAAGGNNLTATYELGFSGNLSVYEGKLNITNGGSCSKSFYSDAVNKEITFNNSVTVTNNNGEVEVNG